MVRRIALGLAWVLVLVGSAARADAGSTRPTVQRQVQYDEQRGVAYTLSNTADGGVQLSGQLPDLVFDKSSYPDGRFELRLTSGVDVVSFTVDATGIEVRRSGGNARLGHDAATEQEFGRTRALLAGSRSVKRFRQLAAALEQSDEASPAAHGVLIAAAMVHLLDGDPGAPSRIARRLTSRRAAAGLRRIAIGQDPMSRSEDCWDAYSQRVNQAYNDFENCQRTRQWYNYEIVSYACSGVWMLRVEGYWFQYLRCSALF